MLGPRTEKTKVEEALEILRQPFKTVTYDPVNAIFINHANERWNEMRMRRNSLQNGKA